MNSWYPEIMYSDAGDGTASKIPFIPVPEGQQMPSVLYVFESRETGDFETDQDGGEYPVMQWDLHQYADMNTLKENLPSDLFDTVRQALGLEPVKVASEKGEKISQTIRKNLE